MSLWKVTIKNSRYVNGVRIERGMSVQVPSTVHPLSSSGLSLVRDAFIRIYGVDLKAIGALNGSYFLFSFVFLEFVFVFFVVYWI